MSMQRKSCCYCRLRGWGLTLMHWTGKWIRRRSESVCIRISHKSSLQEIRQNKASKFSSKQADQKLCAIKDIPCPSESHLFLVLCVNWDFNIYIFLAHFNWSTSPSDPLPGPIRYPTSPCWSPAQFRCAPGGDCARTCPRQQVPEHLDEKQE